MNNIDATTIHDALDRDVATRMDQLEVFDGALTPGEGRAIEAAGEIADLEAHPRELEGAGRAARTGAQPAGCDVS